MPAGVDHHLGLDRSPLGLHAAPDPHRSVDVDRRHPRVGEDLRPAGPRPVGQRGGQQRRVEIAVGCQVGAAAHAVGVHQREQLLRLLGRDQLQRQAEGPRPGDLAQHLLLALRGAGEADPAALHPAAVERAVELDRVHHHARQRQARAQLARRGPPSGRSSRWSARCDRAAPRRARPAWRGGRRSRRHRRRRRRSRRGRGRAARGAGPEPQPPTAASQPPNSGLSAAPRRRAK